jgi:hypothetical protein
MAQDKIPLSEVRKFPHKTLNRMLKKMRECLKKDQVMQKVFKEHSVDIEELDYYPMRFGNLDVSAKTDKGVLIFNYKLLCDGDFLKDYSYGIHEVTHILQQTTGTKPTKGSEDGNYLQNPFEQEAFTNQVEFIADHEGEDQAEDYVDNLLEHHEITDKEEKDELEEVFLAQV